jgi:hypothetical protein
MRQALGILLALTSVGDCEMHAHRCNQCLAQGKQTVWIHGEECKGVETAHTCPVCGGKEWKKWLVPMGSLPHNATATNVGESLTVVSLNAVYIFLILTLVVMTAGFIYRKYGKEIVIPNV